MKRPGQAFMCQERMLEKIELKKKENIVNSSIKSNLIQFRNFQNDTIVIESQIQK